MWATTGISARVSCSTSACAACTALDLDGLGSGFFDEAGGVAEGVLGAGVVAAEGHVDDEKGGADGAADGSRVVQHLVDGERSVCCRGRGRSWRESRRPE